MKAKIIFLLVIVAYVLTSCQSSKPDKWGGDVFANISIYHDEERSVTCWIYDGYYAGGISCIPDDQLGGRNE